MEYVMPEPPHVDGIEWIKTDDGYRSIVLNPVEDNRPTDADLLDDKCTAMDYLNRYYR